MSSGLYSRSVLFGGSLADKPIVDWSCLQYSGSLTNGATNRRTRLCRVVLMDPIAGPNSSTMRHQRITHSAVHRYGLHTV